MPLKLLRRHGSPNWYVRGTVRGIVVDESTGVADRTIAEEIRAKREWDLLQQSIHGAKVTATFLEAAVAYMEAGGERRYLKRLVDHFGTRSLASINQAAIDHAAKVLCPNVAPATVNRQVYTPASAILKHAHKRGLVELRHIERPRQPKGRVRWLTPAEADRLVHACSPHMRPLVIFLFYTGARLSEALYLDWRQVDLDLQQVRFLDTKNGEDRGVPLHPRVLAELRRLPKREGMVFRRPDGQPYRERPGSGSPIKTGFNAACRRAGISDFSPHDCRHTWATWYYAATRDLVGLMKLGGWGDERMVLRYAHMNVSHLSASIAALPWAHALTSGKASNG
jgi:integrase